MEDISDSDNHHAKRICEYFEIKFLDQYQNWSLKHDALLKAFERFRNMCSKNMNYIHKNLFCPTNQLGKFNKDFIKSYNEKIIKDIFLKLMYNILKSCMNFDNDLPFLPEIKKIDKVKKLVVNFCDKK